MGKTRKTRKTLSAVDGNAARDITVKKIAHKSDAKTGRKLHSFVVEGVMKSEGGSISTSTPSALPPDPFTSSYATDGLLVPPYPAEELATLPQYCSELGPCIEAMSVNIEGFGHRFLPRRDIIEYLMDLYGGEDSKEGKKLKREIQLERIRLQNFFDGAGLDRSFTNLRRKKRTDLETIGRAYWEVVPDANGKPDYFVHIPSHEVRMTKADAPVRFMDKRVQIGEDGRPYVQERIAWKRFRRFCQLQADGRKKVWFKEINDPRTIDRVTGEVIPKTGEKRAEWEAKRGTHEAHELMGYSLYDITTPYGLPRYKGSLPNIYGVRRADEINFFTMKSNNVPSMFVLVENGQLTDGTIERITDYVKAQMTDNTNYSRFLIVEAEPTEGDMPGDIGNVKIKIEPLTNVQMKDELFQEFIKHSLERVRRNFRITPIFLGRTDDYTRATAAEARRLTDEQVFQPEREDADYDINYFILPRLGVVWHTFKTNTPNITDTESLTKILSAADRSGGLNPQIARDILETIIGRDFGPISGKIDKDVPFYLQIVKAQVEKKNANAQTGSAEEIKKALNAYPDNLSGLDVLTLIQSLALFRDHIEEAFSKLKGDGCSHEKTES